MPLETPDVVQLEPQEALAIRGVVARDEIGGFLGEAFQEVASTAQESGLVITGPPFAYYPEPPGDSITVDAGFPVSSPADPSGRARRLVLPGGAVVIATHVGHYDAIAQSYEDLERWVGDRGLTPGTSAWETYVTDPDDEPDPARWRTVIHCPLTGAEGP